MNKHVVSVELPSDLFLAVHDLATEQEGTVATVVESLLVDHLETRKTNRTKRCRPNERVVFALQKLLFRDLADAEDWSDLDQRLRKHGYYMKVAWGGLSLHTETSGQKLCNAYDLGFSYGQFIRRFGPGRPRGPHES